MTSEFSTRSELRNQNDQHSLKEDMVAFTYCKELSKYQFVRVYLKDEYELSLNELYKCIPLDIIEYLIKMKYEIGEDVSAFRDHFNKVYNEVLEGHGLNRNDRSMIILSDNEENQELHNYIQEKEKERKKKNVGLQQFTSQRSQEEHPDESTENAFSRVDVSRREGEGLPYQILPRTSASTQIDVNGYIIPNHY